jgi:prophage antirepressor-like protein
MGDLIKFDFRGHNVRQVGTFDAPEWVAKDVCDVLGLVNVSQSLSEMPENEAGICNLESSSSDGRTQFRELRTVKEPGFYRLVSKSRKPDAKAFQSFVFGEVLPSLRRHGCYPPPDGLVVDRPGTIEALTVRLDGYIGRMTEVMESMGKHMGAVTGRIDGVEASVTSLRGDVGQIQLQLESIRANQAQSRRYSMPQKTFETHKLFLLQSVAYSQKCPCCSEKPLFQRGIFTGEKEHATGTGNVTVEQTWLVCKDCNQGILKFNRTGEGQRAFELYQSRLTKWRKERFDLAQLGLFRISAQ